MPVYTYKCRVCGQTFDQVESMGAKPLEVIDHQHDGKLCQGYVFRVVGGAAVQYKGGGWTGAGRDRQK